MTDFGDWLQSELERPGAAETTTKPIAPDPGGGMMLFMLPGELRPLIDTLAGLEGVPPEGLISKLLSDAAIRHGVLQGN